MVNAEVDNYSYILIIFIYLYNKFFSKKHFRDHLGIIQQKTFREYLFHRYYLDF